MTVNRAHLLDSCYRPISIHWNEAAGLIIRGLSGAIAAKTVTYDLERLMTGARKVSCSEFGEEIISHA